MSAPRRVTLVVFTAAFAALVWVAVLVAAHTIDVVSARGLLPRWDLATHLLHAWMDYHYLATGQLHRLLWDLWLQAYWPPMHSIWQVPFFLAHGGAMSGGLWSSFGAFVALGMVGSAALWRQWRDAAVLPIAIFLALLMSSPFMLAYASVAMTEIVGALAQVVVLYCYLRHRQSPGPRTARHFAIALTALFFTKYNYFLLLVVPLALHEGLERTAGLGIAGRLSVVWRWTRWALATPTGAFIGLYVAALAVLIMSGGFAFEVAGQRVSVRTVGSSGHVVLYALLARLWFLHRRGRIDWAGLFAIDPRVKPLLLWLVVPVTVWLASPYPNHIRDVANLVINRPVGEPTVGAGLVTYLDALRQDYFYSEWLLVSVAAVFVLAAARYGRQPPLMQWLILAIPIQFAAVTIHQTRLPRFLLLSIVLLCLAAAAEVGRWLATSGRRQLTASLFAVVVLAAGIAAARDVVTGDRFRALAFSHYTDSAALRAAFDTIRGELDDETRLAVVGRSDALSPALFGWELGAPSGGPRMPLVADDAGLTAIDDATGVLMIVPLGPGAAPAEIADRHPVLSRAIELRVERGELVLVREVPVLDLSVALRLYDRRPVVSAPSFR